MKNTLTARSTVRVLAATALVLFLSGCGGDPIPVPAPPVGNGYGYAAGLGSCPSAGGVQPLQINGSPGYVADLPASNPAQGGDIIVALALQTIAVGATQSQNILGSGAIRIPALTGYYQSSVIPVCVSSANTAPGTLISNVGLRMKLTGALPVLPQGTIPATPMMSGYPYGYQSTQSMGTVEVQIGWRCQAQIVPSGRIIGCIDVYSFGSPGGSMMYQAQ